MTVTYDGILTVHDNGPRHGDDTDRYVIFPCCRSMDVLVMNRSAYAYDGAIGLNLAKGRCATIAYCPFCGTAVNKTHFEKDEGSQ